MDNQLKVNAAHTAGKTTAMSSVAPMARTLGLYENISMRKSVLGVWVFSGIILLRVPIRCQHAGYSEPRSSNYGTITGRVGMHARFN